MESQGASVYDEPITVKIEETGEISINGQITFDSGQIIVIPNE